MQLVSSLTTAPINLFKTCYGIGLDTLEYYEINSTTKEYLDRRIFKIAKQILVLSALYFLDKSCSNLVAIGLLSGIAFPDFTTKMTNDIFTKIFFTKEPEVSYNAENFTKDTPKILWTIGRTFNVVEPALITGFIAFFALPTITIQAAALLTGARFGATGMRSDLF